MSNDEFDNVAVMVNPGIAPGYVVAVARDMETSGVMTIEQFSKRAEEEDLFFDATQEAFACLMFNPVDGEQFLAALPDDWAKQYEAGWGLNP